MDKEARYFVDRVEDKRVPPHRDSNSVVSKGQAKGTDEESLALRKDKDAEAKEEVDEVTEIGEKVVVLPLLVGVVSDW